MKLLSTGPNDRGFSWLRAGRRGPWRTVVMTCLLVAGCLAATGHTASADEGWVINDFHSDIAVASDASMVLTETIAVDFGQLERHGIFRKLRVTYDHDSGRYRKLDVSVRSVVDAKAAPVPYTTSVDGPILQITVGDPDRTVSGRQSYVITYAVRGGMNALQEHDELYWNVNGAGWPVTAERVSAHVHVPGPDLQAATCFQGPTGSKQPCQHTEEPRAADFQSTAPLTSDQQLTVVAGIRKGALATPPILLEDKPRPAERYFELRPGIVVAILLVLLAGLALPGAGLWQGRQDRAYLKTRGPSDDQVQTQPPEGMRPAQLALLLDRSIPGKAWTATICDLAARGYLTISEGRLSSDGRWWWDGERWLPAPGPEPAPNEAAASLAGPEEADWKLSRSAGSAGLNPYESMLLDALFSRSNEVAVSQLKGTIRPTLAWVSNQLHQEAVAGGWIGQNRGGKIGLRVFVGIALLVGGLLFMLIAGAYFGGGWIGAAASLVGLVWITTSAVTVRRPRRELELRRQAAAFQKYIRHLGQHPDELGNRPELFSAYLPYAVAFGAEQPWARAFQNAAAPSSVPSWYLGGANGYLFGMFWSFPLALYESIAYVPPSSSGIWSGGSSSGGGFSSGDSGFSGGSAGGGGGGSGGGSW